MSIPTSADFAKTVQQVIELSRIAGHAEQLRPDTVDLRDVVKSGFKEPPEDAALRAFLAERSQLELLALETLMYMGRDREPERPEIMGVLADYHAYAQEPDARERALTTLMEKGHALAEYLTRGIAVAEAWGFGFEQLFKAALTPPLPPAQA